MTPEPTERFGAQSGCRWDDLGMQAQSMTDRKPKEPSRRKAKRPADKAFDVWLNRGLHQLFDDASHEPIPDELLRIVEEKRNG